MTAGNSDGRYGSNRDGNFFLCGIFFEALRRSTKFILT